MRTTLRVLIGQKRSRLDAGHFKTTAAARIFTGGFVVEQDHVAGGFSKFGAVALVGLAGELVDFAAKEPAQVIRVSGFAERAVESGRFSGLRFPVKSALVDFSD